MDFLLLAVAGVLAGLASTVAGLASVVSYPALLAYGLPPVAANVTNTTALTGVLLGSAVGARKELKPHCGLVVRLSTLCALGGSVGAALLPGTSSDTFSAVVPFFVAGGSLALLARDPIRRVAQRLAQTRPRTSSTSPAAAALFVTGIYAGYFGAAAGIIMLALLSVTQSLPFSVTNAMKTMVTGAGNVAATVLYVALAPVDWGAVAGLGVGLVAGGWLGPLVGRRLPEEPLRLLVGLLGLALAVWLYREQ